jgi:hypothetical protein
LLNIPYLLWPLRLRPEAVTFCGRMAALFIALLASLGATIRSRLELCKAFRHEDCSSFLLHDRDNAFAEIADTIAPMQI